MDTFTLAAQLGRETGTSASRRLRVEDRIPGVVYGRGDAAINVSVDRPALRRVLNEVGPNALINLETPDETVLTLVKDLQVDPLKNRVIHVDFQLVSADELMTVDVPVMLVGEAVEAARAGGVVQQQVTSLTVSAVVIAIPSQLEADISLLTLEDPVRVSEIELPDGVTTDVDLETVVASAQISRAALADTDEAAALLEGEEDLLEEGDETDADESADESAGDD